MIRAATKSVTIRPSISAVHRRVPLVRHQSGTTGKSGKGFGAGKIIATSIVTVAGLAGGTIGYAKNDPEFKLLVEENIPGSKDVFEGVDSLLNEVYSLIGDDANPPPKTIDISVPPSKLKVPMEAIPPMPDIEKPPEKIEEPPEKIETPPEKIETSPENIEEPPVTIEKPEEIVPPPELKVPDEIIEEKPSEPEEKIIQETVETKIEPPTESVETVEPVEALEAIVNAIVEEEIVAPITEEPSKEEIPAEIDNDKAELAELEATLEDACKMMEAKVKQVVESSVKSIDATKDHMALIRGVMDESDPKDEKHAWNEVFEAGNKKSELLKETDKVLSDALEFVKNRVVENIENGRQKSFAQDSSIIQLADERAAASLAELEKVVSALDAVKKEAKLIDDYRNLVEEGRQQFQKEIEAILPGSKLSQSQSGGLSEEELNIFMTHAYRKVCQLQDELAKAQTFNQRSSSEDSASLSDIDVQSELDAQRRELEVEAHRKLTAMREEMEKELKTQMKRQIAAHSDHIKDVLEVQGKELNRIHERALDESLSNQNASHKQELAKIKGWLDALEQSMVQRNTMAQAVFESQKFWLACMSLQKTVEAGADKATVEASVKAVEEAVQNSTTFRDDTFVQILLNSIPKTDVPASSEIKTRFNKVEAMARRTALVGEEGGSLMLYILSYLQSLLIIPPAMTTPMPHKSDDVIDVASLNTFDIAWLARKAMEVNDVEQAVKYVNLLTGEPRRQASDWLVIARLYLELQQSCEALASYAHAIGAEAVPVVAASYK